MRLSRKNNEIQLKIGRAAADSVVVVIGSRVRTIDDYAADVVDRLSRSQRYATVES